MDAACSLPGDNLDALFAPRSVAVVGASNDTARIRGRMLKLLVDGRFSGTVYPVNPGHAQIQGLPAFATVLDLPEAPDLALVAVAADQVMEVLEQCATVGVKAAAIFSAGSSQAEPGHRLQDHVAAFARRTGMRVLGPNAEGFVDVITGLTATFSPTIETLPPRPLDPERGGVSIVSQSGAMAFALYSRAHAEHIPVHHLISTGNEADVELLEVVDYLIKKADSRAILLFVEGLQYPGRLAEVAARAVEAGVPLVIAKVGRSSAGQRAAVSHTAHLTGADTAYDAAFRRFGMIRVDDPELMLAVAAAASSMLWPQGRRVAIVTTSGGAGGWAADICEHAGLEVPAFEPAFKQQLAGLIPDYGSTENPVDVTARVVEDGGATLLALLDRLGQAPDIDIGLVIMSLVARGRITSIERALANLRAAAKRPLVFHSPGRIDPQEREALARTGYLHLELRAFAGAMRLLDDYRRFRERWLDRNGLALEISPPACHTPRAGIRFDGAQTRDFLTRWNIPLPAEKIVRTLPEALAAAEMMGWPIALKIVSPDIAHKTEAGGVALGIGDPNALHKAYARMLNDVTRRQPNARIEGVQVQKMMPIGHEMVVSIIHDPDFGPMVMLGFGGIYVEVMRDVVFAIAPLTFDDAHDLIDRLASRAVLDGVRGQPASDRQALCRLLVSVSELAMAHADDIAELELNPVLVYPAGQGLVAVDALIVPSGAAIEQTRGAGHG